MPYDEHIVEPVPVTSDNASLKRVMLDTLQRQCQLLIATACEKGKLPPNDPGYFDPQYMDRLNKNVLTMGATLKSIITNASTTEVLCENLRGFNEAVIQEDEDDSVASAAESTIHPIYTAVLEAGLAHLDPHNKRVNLPSSSAGQQVVSLAGRDVHVSRARQIESVLQEYTHSFDVMAERVCARDSMLADLNGEAIDTVHFTRKGLASEDEIKACILAAAQAQFAACRDHVAQAEELRDSRKAVYLNANQHIFEDLNETMTNEHNPTLGNLMAFIDNAIENDFWDEDRDTRHLFYQTWTSDLLHKLEKKLKENVPVENLQGNVTSLHAARLRKQEESDEVEIDESMEAWLSHIAALKQYAAAGPDAMQACDAIVAEKYGYPKSMLAVEAQAKMEEIEIAELSDAGFDALCNRTQEALQAYMSSHFFDRVNALKLRDAEGPIELDFDCDDDGNEQTYPLQAYMLVRKAYDAAKQLMPSGLEGTAFYDKALKRCEDQLLVELARSDAWKCCYTDDFPTAKQTLLIAAETIKRQRG